MGILDWVGSLFKPVADLVDNVHTSTEEKMALTNKMAEIQQAVNAKIIELEEKRLDAISKVEVAESASTHWLRANWRPVSSLLLVGVTMYLSLRGLPIPGEISSLTEILVGTYAGGRSLEKIAAVVKGVGK